MYHTDLVCDSGECSVGSIGKFRFVSNGVRHCCKFSVFIVFVSCHCNSDRFRFYRISNIAVGFHTFLFSIFLHPYYKPFLNNDYLTLYCQRLKKKYFLLFSLLNLMFLLFFGLVLLLNLMCFLSLILN